MAYVVHEVSAAQQCDLYQLQFFLKRFSAHDLGRIANELIELLSCLHERQLYLKFLNPRTVAAQSFNLLKRSFDLTVPNLTVLSLLGLSENRLCSEKTCSSDNLFIAPEMFSPLDGTHPATPQADIWSVGAILYVLVTGGAKEACGTKPFDFDEAAWRPMPPELIEFVQGCL